MTDPLSVVLIGAVAGGAAGGAATKFVETALTSGGKWVMAKFADHSPQAIAKAQSNSNEFLNILGKHLASLENTQAISSEKIAQALESPDFSMALHNALISAAQTDSQEKHEYLSQLILEHLHAETESTLALSAKLACTVVSSLTHNQLSILGAITAIRFLRPQAVMSPENLAAWAVNFTAPYRHTKCGELDWQHLQALGCLHKTMLTHDLRGLFQRKGNNGIADTFFQSENYLHLQSLWERLGPLELTTVGQLIGIKIASHKVNAPISLSAWEEW